MATSLIEPPTSGLVRRQWREGGPGATDRNECRSVGGSGGARLGGVYPLHRDRLAAEPLGLGSRLCERGGNRGTGDSPWPGRTGRSGLLHGSRQPALAPDATNRHET